MNPDAILAFTRRSPFVPFRVHVAEITHYDVLHPEWIMVGGAMAFIGGRRDPNSPIFDEPIVIALRHITRLEPLDVPTPAA